MTKKMDREGRTLRDEGKKLDVSIRNLLSNLSRSDRANGAASAESEELRRQFMEKRARALVVRDRLRDEYGVSLVIRGL